MFKNYLKIALRNLLKYRGYTVINVIGLAIGMAACIIMLLYIEEELSYDKFHHKGERIYRITDKWSSGELSEDLATAPFPVGRVFQLENPDLIESMVRLHQPSIWGNTTVISFEGQTFVEKGLMFADSTFFRIFDFDFIQGNARTALRSPNAVVITEEISRKYFGQDNPMGKRLSLNNRVDLEVTGVLHNIPQNSHIKFDLLTSLGTLRNWWGWSGFEQGWIWQAVWTYLLLDHPESASSLQTQLTDFVQRHFPESVRDGSVLTLQPLRDIHLHSQRYLEIETNGNILYVYVFSAIAILILFIACINFMNLATARSSQRAREVGMRRVLGAYRTHLILQFLGESIVLSVISLLTAIALIEVALPLFNSLTGKALEIHYFENPLVLLGLLGVGLLVGILSGSYPALYLSGFRPISVLKGNPTKTDQSGEGATSLRKVLVVSQFAVSLVLLICISVIYNQLNFLKNKELGIVREQVMYFELMGNTFGQYGAIKNRLLESNDIMAVSMIGGSVPGLEDGIANAFVAEGMSPDKPKWIGMITATHDIEKVLGLELVAGRFFSLDFPTDSTQAFIVNETALREFGWSLDEALGKTIERVRSDGSVSQSGKVIGVVRDFHFEPLHEELKPLIIRFGGGLVALRVRPDDIQASVAHVRQTWDRFVPEWPLSYRFLDDDIEHLYRREQKLGQVIQYFTILAIFIACLGLFGLAAFTAEQRTKEVGIRKVMGATVGSLVVLLCREFTRLVAIAFVIASPLAYWVMQRWLDNFAYRVSVDAWVFLIAGSLAMLIAIVTVSMQAMRAALVNPVESLRYE